MRIGKVPVPAVAASGSAAVLEGRPAARRPLPPASAPWPAEAEFIMSALEAGRAPADRRRNGERIVHRAVGELKLFSDRPGAGPWTLYTRDATTRGMGFITRHRLPLGYGGILRLRGPNGEELSIDCTVRRCRETVHGWFEGSLSFNRDQWAFDAENVTESD
jgi:hypothetical protein